MRQFFTLTIQQPMATLIVSGLQRVAIDWSELPDWIVGRRILIRSSNLPLRAAVGQRLDQMLRDNPKAMSAFFDIAGTIDMLAKIDMPPFLPLGSLLGTAIIGEAAPMYELKDGQNNYDFPVRDLVDAPVIRRPSLREYRDSTRLWAWPLTDVEELEFPVAVGSRGGGFWTKMELE